MPNNNPKGWANKPPVKEASTRAKTRGKVNLRDQDFEALLDQQGVRVRVWRTMFCPNVKSIDGGEHDINCNVCKANGFLDVSPIETVAFIQSQDLTKVFKAEGYWDGNSVSATFKAGIEVQYFTLIELLDHTDVFFQRIKRQRGPVDRLKYSAKCVNAVVDQRGKEYLPGDDFEIDENGDMRWKPNKGPLKGDIYSIHYDALIQFRAQKAMHVNRFGQITEGAEIVYKKLPEQWLITREFLIDRKDSEGDSLQPNRIRNEDKQDLP